MVKFAERTAFVWEMSDKGVRVGDGDDIHDPSAQVRIRRQSRGFLICVPTNYGGRRFDAPCLAYLLRGGGQDILIDTGPGPKARVPQHYTAAEANIDDLLLAELGRLDVDPEAIRIVVLTHLHNDHVGGVPHFPAATFYVQEAELREAAWPVPFQRPIYEVNQRGRRPPWVEILDRMEVPDRGQPDPPRPFDPAAARPHERVTGRAGGHGGGSLSAAGRSDSALRQLARRRRSGGAERQPHRSLCV